MAVLINYTSITLGSPTLVPYLGALISTRACAHTRTTYIRLHKLDKLRSFVSMHDLFGYRFDGADFLRRWKGKKIMFVGDSLSLNQWNSLVCMLHAAAPKANTSFVRGNPISYITFQVSLPFCSLVSICFHWWKILIKIQFSRTKSNI